MDIFFVLSQKFSIAGVSPSFSLYNAEMNNAPFLEFCARNLAVDFVAVHLEFFTLNCINAWPPWILVFYDCIFVNLAYKRD
jgi:hypothetical protein